MLARGTLGDFSVAHSTTFGRLTVPSDVDRMDLRCFIDDWPSRTVASDEADLMPSDLASAVRMLMDDGGGQRRISI